MSRNTSICSHPYFINVSNSAVQIIPSSTRVCLLFPSLTTRWHTELYKHEFEFQRHPQLIPKQHGSTPLLSNMRMGILSERPKTYWLSLLITTLVILRTCPSAYATQPRLAHGQLSCTNIDLFGVIHPKAADCRTVLQHLPNISNQTNTLYPLSPALQASPFLPPLSIGHGTCRFDFSFEHERQDGDPEADAMLQVPMAAIWRLMRHGAQQIVEGCRSDEEYGWYFGELEAGDEGVTTVRVTNFLTTEMEEEYSDKTYRSRARLRIGMTATGRGLWTGYFYYDARYDVFVTQGFDV